MGKITATTIDRLRRNDSQQKELVLELSSATTCAELDELTNALQLNRTLQYISINYADNRVSKTEETRAPALQEGIANSNQKGDTKTASCKTIAALHKVLGNIQSLQKLSIHGSAKHCIAPLCEANSLLFSVKYCVKLTIVGVTFDASRNDWDQFASTLQHHPNLREVRAGTQVFRREKSGSVGFSSSIVQEKVMQALADSTTINSVILNGDGLRATPLTVESSRSLFSSKCLSNLQLFDISFADAHLTMMENALKSHHQMRHLKKLTVSSCTFGPEGWESLANIVEATSQTLASTKLSGGVFQLKVLILWIEDAPLLNDCRQTWDKCEQSILRLARGLQDSSIRDFQLRASWSTQQRLKSTIQLADTGQEDIEGKRRPHHPIASSLVHSAFSQMLECNYILETLSVPCSPYSKRQILLHDFYLSLNKLGRRRLFGNTCGDRITAPTKRSRVSAGRSSLLGWPRQVPRDDWINVLGEARHDLSCIYYFLSANPALCHC